jgi:hypothetical protein
VGQGASSMNMALTFNRGAQRLPFAPPHPRKLMLCFSTFCAASSAQCSPAFDSFFPVAAPYPAFLLRRLTRASFWFALSAGWRTTCTKNLPRLLRHHRRPINQHFRHSLHQLIRVLTHPESPHSRRAPPHVASLAPTLALASSRTFLQTALCSRPPASPVTRHPVPRQLKRCRDHVLIHANLHRPPSSSNFVPLVCLVS